MTQITDTQRLELLAELWSPNPSYGYGNLGGNLDLATVGGAVSTDLRAAIDLAIQRAESANG